MNIIENYNKAYKALLDHVGLNEDWVVCPIDMNVDMIWEVDEYTCKYAKSVDQFLSDGDYYEDEIYTQRFYPKWVYEGKEYTLVFCNPGVDGMKWWRVFKNSNRASIRIRDKKIEELMGW
jgi:hypothetical protein